MNLFGFPMLTPPPFSFLFPHRFHRLCHQPLSIVKLDCETIGKVSRIHCPFSTSSLPSLPSSTSLLIVHKYKSLREKLKELWLNINTFIYICCLASQALSLQLQVIRKDQPERAEQKNNNNNNNNNKKKTVAFNRHELIYCFDTFLLIHSRFRSRTVLCARRRG